MSEFTPEKPKHPRTVEEIRRNLNAVIPGPWWYRPKRTRGTIHTKGRVISDNLEITTGSNCLPNLATGSFIAHARTDVPFLLDEVDALTAEIDRLKRQIAHLQACSSQHCARWVAAEEREARVREVLEAWQASAGDWVLLTVEEVTDALAILGGEGEAGNDG